MDELRILLIEDTKADQSFFKHTLQSIGIFNRIETIPLLGEALPICHNFDLILLDIFLPDSDSATSILRLKEKTSAAIFVLSGQAEENRKEYFNIGADWVLQKPIDPIGLVTAILTLKKGNLRLLRIGKNEA